MINVSHAKRVTWLLIAICLVVPPISAEESYQQVKSYIESDRVDLAVAELNREVANNPDDYRAWFLLGVAYTRVKEFHQAMESFRRVIEINPKLAEPHNNLAVIYNELEDYRAAVSQLEISLVKKPGDTVATEGLADLYVKLALENYQRALAKTANPALKQRYVRLLKVRDPRAGSALSENRSLSPLSEVKAKPAIEKPVIASVKKIAGKRAQVLVDREALEKSLREAIEMWRKAWSERNLEAYFLMYADNFEVPSRFASVELWKQYKQRVIASKSFIRVELSDLKIVIDPSGKRAIVDFFQKFRSNSYNGDGPKRLEMILHNNEWKIAREDSVS